MNRHQLPEMLFNQVHMVEPYPDNVKPVSEMMKTTAFFPGEYGLWLEENSFVYPDILVLGHDFSTVVECEKLLLSKQSEINFPTWRELRKLFLASNIILIDVFSAMYIWDFEMLVK